MLQVIEKLIDIVTYMHQEISDIFGNKGTFKLKITVAPSPHSQESGKSCHPVSDPIRDAVKVLFDYYMALSVY